MPGVYEITSDAGSAFFLRAEYLSDVKEERLVCVRGGLEPEDSLFMPSETLSAGEPGVFSDEEAADILRAALVYSAETAAMSYLARAEQSRSGLTRKLLRKGLDGGVIGQALDYLERQGYLSDRRFAGAWLRSRSIDHAEGRSRLSAELAARGIGREDRESALDEFFESCDEGDLCLRALRKSLRTKKYDDREKLYASLMRAGFSLREIKGAFKRLENERPDI